MGLSNRLDLKQVAKAYLFANTPLYLYRRLRNIASVKELGEDTPLNVLITEYNKRTSKKRKTVEDIAVAYSLLITTTFWDYQQAKAALDNFNLSLLDWGRDIKDIFISTSPITNIIGILVEPTYKFDKQTSAESSSSTLVLDLNSTNKGEKLC